MDPVIEAMMNAAEETGGVLWEEDMVVVLRAALEASGVNRDQVDRLRRAGIHPRHAWSEYTTDSLLAAAYPEEGRTESANEPQLPPPAQPWGGCWTGTFGSSERTYAYPEDGEEGGGDE